MKRRKFIRNTGLLAGILAASHFSLAKSANPTFLIVSGWQTVNIGDIAHTPGMLSLIYRFFPEAKCILWPKDINLPVEKMLMQNFPDLEILYFDPESTDSTEIDQFNRTVELSDMLIHSSGPGLIGINHLARWRERTDKPFGVIGITLGSLDDPQREILKDAAFIFTRETSSLQILEKENFQNVITGFAPDSTFAMNLSDESSSGEFMDLHGLKEKEFICVIPRLRYTPYHLIHPDIGWSDEKIRNVAEINNRYQEEDHAKMRHLISWWISETGNKVVVCPEMTYQTGIMDSLLINPLADPLKNKMVKHDYWLPDEAASLYKKAFAVISMECHSPIMAAVNGTPCFYLRQPQDTIKGQMWYDLGLDEWVFELEETPGTELAEGLEIVYHNYPQAKEYLQAGMNQANKLYVDAFRQIQGLL